MRGLFRRREHAVRSSGTWHDFDRLLKRVRIIPLAAPILIATGWLMGSVTTRSLSVPLDRSGVTRSEVRSGEVPKAHIERLTADMERLQTDGAQTLRVASIFRTHVLPVEQILRRRGVSAPTARQVAWPLALHAQAKRLDPATVLSVLLVESEGNPRATSSVGARGLMQIMPLWAGKWRGCGRDLYAIEDNICTGTKLLDWYIDRSGGDLHRALLGYNGCVHGTNTPNCRAYPDRVEQLRDRLDREMQRIRLSPPKFVGR